MVEREKLNIKTALESDCAPLNIMIEGLLETTTNIHVLRDPTRGGIATILNEIASQSKVGIRIIEENLHIKSQVKGICSILGMDPLYMANEGKMIIIAPKTEESLILSKLKEHKEGIDSFTAGYITDEHPKKVVMSTITGGSRIIDMLTGDQLPRIC
jgi:hydrogenase expression/formation protein HypE